MADHRVLLFVIDQGKVTFRAFHHRAAGAAGYKIGIPASILKENDLLSLFQSFLDGGIKPAAKNIRIARAQLFPHIDNFNPGQRIAVISLL